MHEKNTSLYKNVYFICRLILPLTEKIESIFLLVHSVAYLYFCSAGPKQYHVINYNFFLFQAPDEKRKRIEAQSLPVRSILELMDDDDDDANSNESVSLLAPPPPQCVFNPLLESSSSSFFGYLHCTCFKCHGCQCENPPGQICITNSLLICPNSEHYKHRCSECIPSTDSCPYLKGLLFTHCTCTKCCGCQVIFPDGQFCNKPAPRLCPRSPYLNHTCTHCNQADICPFGGSYTNSHCSCARYGTCCGCNEQYPQSNTCSMPAQAKCLDSALYGHECTHCFTLFPW